MAYTIPWDEAQPDGSEASNTIDTEIQNAKTSIRERLEDLFPDWSDDGVDPKVFARVQVSLTSVQSISDATSTAIAWDQTEYETVSSMWDIANPSRLVAPTAGFYLVIANVQFAANTTGIRTVSIRQGNSVSQTLAGQETTSAALITDLSVSWMGILPASDYVEMFVFQNSTGALDVTANPQTNFSMTRLA